MKSWRFKCLEVLIVISALSILQKPELAGEIDIKALGKLLTNELLKPLEEQYLSTQQVTPAAATCLTPLDFSHV